MDLEELRRLLTVQSGVVSRGQLRAIGAAKNDVDRMVRRRELTRVTKGVYVDHTGHLSWLQCAWAAVLCASPAALCLSSALPGPNPDGPIHVAIDADRRVADRPGVRIHRIGNLDAKVQWNLAPPRMRPEYNTLELVHRAKSEHDVIRFLTDAVNSRRTTVARLRTALASRGRLRRRRWIIRLLDDLEMGVCSVLEHGYLTRVERAHGLPRSRRQAPRRDGRGSEYRDALYEKYGLVVELDGAAWHDDPDARDRDADRDLDDHADGRETVRLRWRQVFGRSCRTADRIARILQRRGWTGAPHGCGPECGLADA